MSALLHQRSGSDEEPRDLMDQRKRKRMLSNRESARRSRMKKQKHLDDLIGQLTQLSAENSLITSRIDDAAENFAKLEAENAVLKAQVMQLTERLRSLNSVLYIMEAISGSAIDIPEIPHPFLRPLQLPCPSLPIMASANMFQF